MNVIFISNYLNYHQSQLWDRFILNENVHFVFLELEHEKSTIKSQENRSYNISFESIDGLDLPDFLNKFDIIIIGQCKNNYILSSLPHNKIIFHCSEHYWKKYNTPLSLIKRIYRMLELRKRYKTFNNIYFLASSARLKKELDFFSIKYCNCFRFGYFPPIDKNYFSNKKWHKNIIFVGRAVRWKRPEYSLVALKEFNSVDNGWKLNIFSEGAYLSTMRLKAKKYNFVKFHPFVPHEEVLKNFKESDVFIFSSNHEEGWGAVLNEALSCGTIVFASTSAGATKYLIKDGYNGFTFKTKSELKKKIRLFLEMSDCEKEQIRMNAFLTIANKWNEQIASERMFLLFKKMLNNETLPIYKDGPLSIDG